jgi:dTDP-glucose 4,6-dehydratase
MNWGKEKVVVTGGTGFVGNHLVSRLIELGVDVTVFAHYNSQNSLGMLNNISDNVRIAWGDIKNSESVEKACKGCSIIFHLAALVGIPYSYQHPEEVTATNVFGALNVLKYARDNDVKKVVITSTSEVYGTAKYIPMDEKHPLQGQSPYSASKIASDKLAESFYCSYNLPVAICRPFNIYGVRQSMRAVIPTIINQALYRGEIHLGALSPMRDFTYVADTVEGFIKIAESPLSVGEVINIGSGKEISIEGVAAKICGLVGKNIPIISDEDRIRPINSEVNRLCSDSRKAKNLLGWMPQVSLEEGLFRTINSISSHHGEYEPSQYYV